MDEHHEAMARIARDVKISETSQGEVASSIVQFPVKKSTVMTSKKGADDQT
jgi:hypothetical protein